MNVNKTQSPDSRNQKVELWFRTGPNTLIWNAAWFFHFLWHLYFITALNGAVFHLTSSVGSVLLWTATFSSGVPHPSLSHLVINSHTPLPVAFYHSVFFSSPGLQLASMLIIFPCWERKELKNSHINGCYDALMACVHFSDPVLLSLA